jgi:acetyl esterase/lipase
VWAALALLVCFSDGVRAEPDQLEALVYTDATDGPTLDLYLPAAEQPPLLVFVHSHFWARQDRARELATQLARPLQRLGVAVAIVRHRLAPTHPHPAGAEDVARAIDFLLDRPGGEFDPERVFLAGHDSGGHLATLLALDPQYLAAVGRSPGLLRGVAGLSGHYDLEPEAGTLPQEAIDLIHDAFPSRRARRKAAPLHLAHADAPPFLLLYAQRDLPGAGAAANRFAEALRTAGHAYAEAFPIAGRDHWSLLDLRSAGEARRHLLMWLGVDETYGTLAEVFDTRRYWRAPALSTKGFWKESSHVVTRDADDALIETLNLPFQQPGNPRPLVPLRYDALDLRRYVERNVQGAGDYLVVRNAKGEELVWRLSEIAPYEPEIVVGLDGRRELFEFVTYYHTNRRYTWKEAQEAKQVMARPLGAFIHFRKRPPPELDPKLLGRFALLPDSFRRSETDPWGAVRSLDASDQALLTTSFHCLTCHQLRGVGARAGHLRARDGTLVGGFGLPLESYPEGVWQRYCFEQDAVAAEIGATPVPFSAREVEQLFELVERERSSR